MCYTRRELWLIWKTRKAGRGIKCRSQGDEKTQRGSFPPIMVDEFQTFPKAREKNVQHPNGTSTTPLLRLGKRYERFYQEKTALLFQRIANPLNSWGKKSVYYWRSTRRKKASYPANSTIAKSVTIASVVFPEFLPGCCRHCTELVFSPKKVIWFNIRNGIIFVPFLRPRLYLPQLNFRNSRYLFISSISPFY